MIFVGAERGNFVAVFEDRPGAEPAFVQLLPTAVGPEGLLAIPQRDLFVVSSEVDSEEDGLRGTVGIYARSADAPPYPTVDLGHRSRDRRADRLGRALRPRRRSRRPEPALCA